MRDYVKNEVDGKWYAVDSAYTWDHGYETMIFECYRFDPDWDVKTKNEFIDWTGLYTEYHEDAYDMVSRHKIIVELLSKATLHYDEDYGEGWFIPEELGWHYC